MCKITIDSMTALGQLISIVMWCQYKGLYLQMSSELTVIRVEFRINKDNWCSESQSGKRYEYFKTIWVIQSDYLLDHICICTP